MQHPGVGTRTTHGPTQGRRSARALPASSGGNCGDMASGVGSFAVRRGLVAAQSPTTRVRILNTNTGKVLTAEVAVEDGQVVEEATSSCRHGVATRLTDEGAEGLRRRARRSPPPPGRSPAC
ncbi:PrpF domain-containing protein [Nocardioides sp. cx-169]|uniref:PrpF domain-containing protein n=1 Tax=Nocardioides sp. cx-169 TaxID=2899080 RepID=UPI0035A99993